MYMNIIIFIFFQIKQACRAYVYFYTKDTDDFTIMRNTVGPPAALSIYIIQPHIFINKDTHYIYIYIGNDNDLTSHWASVLIDF